MTWFPYPTTHNMRNLRKFWDRGEPCPVAFWIGHHPAVLLGTQAKLRYPESHWAAAGGVLGAPLRVVFCRIAAWRRIAGLRRRCCERCAQRHGRQDDVRVTGDRAHRPAAQTDRRLPGLVRLPRRCRRQQSLAALVHGRARHRDDEL
ncbi:MAG: hypothetical protein EBY28_27265 [Betaproteobacteria bacterium]|nr:hypothetical protein [Betaproteobacteria bacterium]